MKKSQFFKRLKEVRDKKEASFRLLKFLTLKNRENIFVKKITFFQNLQKTNFKISENIFLGISKIEILVENGLKRRGLYGIAQASIFNLTRTSKFALNLEALILKNMRKNLDFGFFMTKKGKNKISRARLHYYNRASLTI